MSLRKAACFIDAQGFTFRDEFVIREIAFVSDKMQISFECETNLQHFDTTMRYQFLYLHGLTLSPLKEEFMVRKNDLRKFIKYMVGMLVTDEKPLVAIKNQQLEKILKEMDIPIVSLDRLLLIPPLKQTSTCKDVDCKNHYFVTKKCALAKSIYYWTNI